MKTRLLHVMLAAVAGAGCLFVSDQASMIAKGSLITEANAIIGRPLTPLSYAGVARRTTRRAIVAAPYVAAPVVVAPAVVAPVVVAPRCVQAVDPYGRIYTRCY
jgi:hypothetical protein